MTRFTDDELTPRGLAFRLDLFRRARGQRAEHPAPR